MVRLALNRFENIGFLVNQSTKQSRLITICNWESYQSKDYAEGNTLGNEGAEAGQSEGNHRATNNNVKNEKKVKKGTSSSSNKFLSFREMEILRAQERMNKVMEEFENENVG